MRRTADLALVQVPQDEIRLCYKQQPEPVRRNQAFSREHLDFKCLRVQTGLPRVPVPARQAVRDAFPRHVEVEIFPVRRPEQAVDAGSAEPAAVLPLVGDGSLLAVRSSEYQLFVCDRYAFELASDFV